MNSALHMHLFFRSLRPVINPDSATLFEARGILQAALVY